jgi:acyl transferase domain-containing protein/thioesterase domain-containing protein
MTEEPAPEPLDDADDGELEAIAIIGMAGRFPLADDIDQYWENLVAGRECLTEFTADDIVAAGVPRRSLSEERVRSRGVLDGAEWFEPGFFGYSPREAEIMDPQQRVFLEVSWEALEAAGYDSKRAPGPVGVFAGSGINTYFNANVQTRPEILEAFGMFPAVVLNEKDFLSTRVAYALDLHGPAVSIQTACSTSLVSVCYAAQSLLNYECDLALAGGASAVFPQCHSSIHEEGGMIARDGHCRPFDASASGTLFSDGVGVVVLRRLSEAIEAGDHIHAVIKGFAVNNDGAGKAGFTAPSVDGQAQVIQAAQEFAGVSPESIGYIEAHGTATPLGDPIEIAGLAKAFGKATDRSQFCGIGSAKSNLGHLDVAAGIAGLIKTALALENELIPATINFDEPNPRIDWESTPFYVIDEATRWERSETPRRAGVSSFGIGGTNAHVVLEEAPLPRATFTDDRPAQLLVLSARTETALEASTTDLADRLARDDGGLDLGDVSFTLQTGRRAFAHRRAVVSTSTADAAAALESRDRRLVDTSTVERLNRPVVFMFSGQGSQHVDMCKGLYETEPEFRDCVDACAAKLEPLIGRDLREVMYPAAAQREAAADTLTQTAFTQPALFVVEYALARLWQSWGLAPSAMFGHSIGEYVAACLAGIFSLDDALSLVAARGRLMQSLPSGSMLAVPMPEADLAAILDERTCVSVINSPSMCVVSGDHEAIDDLEAKLTVDGVQARRVQTSHAFHSPMMEPILDEFREEVRRAQPQPPKTKLISNLTGKAMTESEAVDPDYWAQHLRHAVRFADCISTLLDDPDKILLEVGPGRTLSSLARMHPAKSRSTVVLSAARHPDEAEHDSAFALRTAGRLWLAGLDIDWEALHADRGRSRVPLPTYPFERVRCWIEPGTTPRAGEGAHPAVAEHSALPKPATTVEEAPPTSQDRGETVEEAIAGIWEDLLGVKDITRDDNFFELGGTSLIAVRMFVLIEERCGCNLPISTLMNAPTPSGLAEVVRAAGPSQEAPGWAPLVPVRPEGSEAPVFFVHAEEGNVLFYQALADRMDLDRPFYGLQARGLDGRTDPGGITDMAADYVAQIRTVQPTGPYFLGGFCLGGAIAVEMARQLRESGEEVGPVVMIQTQHPDYYEEANSTLVRRIVQRPIDRLAYEASQIRTATGHDRVNYLRRKARGLGEIVRLAVAREGQASTDNAVRTRALAATHRDAFLRHCQAPYDGPVLVIRAGIQPRANSDDPLLGWGPTLTGEVRCVTVDDTHHREIMHEPAVYEVAAAVNDILDRSSAPSKVS